MIRRFAPVTALLAALLFAGNAAAQSFPPHRFFGVVTIDGQPAAATTTLRAFIGNTECASATVGAAGSYVIDIPGVTINPNCGRNRQSTITFRIGDRAAQQTPTYRDGGFEQLNLTFGSAAPPPPPTAFNAATLNLSDPRPCIPEPGQARCDAEREALWNADRAAWARRGVVEQPPFVPFEGAVFNETIVFRVQAGDQAAISNIARIIGQPYVQVTFIRFRGSQPGQVDEYVEVTNLGGADETLGGWSLRSPARNQRFVFPPGFVLAAGQSCRVYTGAPLAESCGGASFNSTDVWPDDAGQIILFVDPIAILAADVRYSADPNNQPPPPNLQGVNDPT